MAQVRIKNYNCKGKWKYENLIYFYPSQKNSGDYVIVKDLFLSKK